MRYARVVMTPASGSFHPLGESLGEEVEITREAIHKVDLLEDGTCTMLSEIRGDLDRYRQILEESDAVLDCAVAGAAQGFAYLRFEPTDFVEYLIRQRREMELVTEMPIELTEDGSHILTLIGDEDAFRRAGRATPAGVEMELVETGEYHPESSQLSAQLTERQLEILEHAVELGYYDTPRRGTQADIAEAVELSPTTVGEHLRKIEKRVFSRIV
jgi:DNA-binding NarL/FixJ family response regulator